MIDEGWASPLRSQALWHGLSAAMAPEASPVLSFCRPASPYVSLGFHRALAEIDTRVCERRGWPVIRRQIGGGPVYLDRDQLFFQITLPANRAPVRVDQLYSAMLTPAIEAFRALGIAAELRGTNDIAIENRRLSGTGAGRIGDGVTVVGNVIFDFPHRRMVECLALPGSGMRRECLRLMELHVSSLAREGAGAVTAERAKAALIEAYARALSSSVRQDRLAIAEEEAIDAWQSRLGARGWLRGANRRATSSRQVKICAGVWVFSTAAEGLEARISVIDGTLERVTIEGAQLNGQAAALSEALVGGSSQPHRVELRLRPFGNLGRRLAAMLEPGLTLG